MPPVDVNCREVVFGRILVRRFEGRADDTYEAESLDREHLCFVCAGGLTEQRAGDERLREPGSLRLSPPGDAHRVRFGPAGLRCLMLVDREGSSRTGGFAPRMRLADADGRAAAWRVVHEMAAPCPASVLVVEESALELFASAHGSRHGRERRVPAWLAATRDAVRAQYSRPPSLTSLAGAVSVHPVHLARSFKSHYGYTIGECARRARLAAAYARLSRPGASLARIAIEGGFTDQSHLTRECRRYLRLTPRQIRQQREDHGAARRPESLASA